MNQQEFLSALHGNVEAVKKVLDNLGGHEYIKQQFLDRACIFGYTEVVRELILRDVNLNITDTGKPPLYQACYYKYPKIVEMLLENGADPNKPASDGTTPINVASRGSLEIVNLLLKAGADPSISNNRGDTPLHSASRMGSLEIVKLLSKAGADPSIPNDRGDTPLHEAGARHSEIVKFLLTFPQVDPNVSNIEGETPLYSIILHSNFRDQGDPEITDSIMELLTNGADPSLALIKCEEMRVVMGLSSISELFSSDFQDIFKILNEYIMSLHHCSLKVIRANEVKVTSLPKELFLSN